MLEYDWFLTAHIYSLILLCNSKTVRFDLSDYQKLACYALGRFEITRPITP